MVQSLGRYKQTELGLDHIVRGGSRESGDILDRYYWDPGDRSEAIHTLKSPLASIKVATALLREQGLVKDGGKGYIAQIDQQAHALLELVENMLLKPNSLKPINMEQIPLKRFCRLKRQQLNNSIARGSYDFRMDVDGSVFCDREILDHVVNELCLNAFKYSPDGGLIHISGGRGKLIIGNHSAIPLKDGERYRVFEPRARGSNVGRKFGSGFGLTLVQQMLWSVGATIELLTTTDDPKPGAYQYITFRICFRSK